MFDTFEDIKKAINENARRDKNLFDDYFMKYFSEYIDCTDTVNKDFVEIDDDDLPF